MHGEFMRIALDEAKMAAREGEIPVVMHRKNNCEWLCTMKLIDWIEMYREWKG